MMLSTPRRPAFTLVELMVVMGIIAFLSALVMLVAPDVLAKDRARDAASQLQGALQNARMRAMRDGMPRGVRLIVDDGSSYYTVSSNQPISSAFTIASSYQYLEVPPWLLFTNQSGQAGMNPYLQLTYNLVNGQISPGANAQPPARTCTIGNLTQGQFFQLQSMLTSVTGSQLPPTLGLPTLNFWTTIQSGSFPPNQKFPFSCTLVLNVWPDAPMGAANTWITYAGSYVSGSGTVGSAGDFGIYQSPRPLLGEPIVNMPVNTCVDLSDGVSQPSFALGLNGYQSSSQSSGTYNVASAPPTLMLPGYDILFSPSGQMMMPYGASQAYLWVRDPTKGNGTSITNPNPNQGAYFSEAPSALGGSYTSLQYAAFLPAGGEQLLVTIKANSGGTGVTPVFWPTAALPTPYGYAINAANTP